MTSQPRLPLTRLITVLAVLFIVVFSVAALSVLRAIPVPERVATSTAAAATVAAATTTASGGNGGPAPLSAENPLDAKPKLPPAPEKKVKSDSSGE